MAQLAPVADLLVAALLVTSCSSTHCGSNSTPSHDASATEADSATVMVRDPSGNPVQGARVWFKPISVEYYNAVPVTTGPSGLASSRDSDWADEREDFDVVVVHEGHRTVTLRGFVGHVDVRLARASPTRVRINIAPSSVLPDAPWRLVLRLDWMDRDGIDDPRLRELTVPADIAAGDHVTFDVDDPGLYLLWASKHTTIGALGEQGNPSHGVMRTVAADPWPIQIVVEEDDSDHHEVDVRLDATRRAPD